MSGTVTIIYVSHIKCFKKCDKKNNYVSKSIKKGGGVNALNPHPPLTRLEIKSHKNIDRYNISKKKTI